MSALAIRVDGLAKEYRLGLRAPSGNLLSEQIGEACRRPFRRWLASASDAEAESGARRPASFWALANVGFEVARGETVGIIGRNGAGKSTLLKILSRITLPTRGRVELYDRIGSLLEVGTGFHPELTGRENIFLNGAILGMRRAEIARKFDEIVAFAEIERFIDTPVKRYSSGMAVRLAFAVAAHLEPEILVIDEVLAVGDTAFQKKCLGKMGQVAREGRTVLFVSHDLTAIQVLCRKALHLSKGRVEGYGPVNEEIVAYLAASRGITGSELDRPIPLTSRLRLVRFGASANPVASGAPAAFDVALESDTPARFEELAVVVSDTLGRRVGVIDFRKGGVPLVCRADGGLRLTAALRTLPLVEGEYRLGLACKHDGVQDLREELVTLDVTGPGDGAFVPYRAEVRGLVAFDYAVDVSTGA